MQTFSEKQMKTQRISQLEKDKQLVLTAIKRKIQFFWRYSKHEEGDRQAGKADRKDQQCDILL
jgi:hypothetical protein